MIKKNGFTIIELAITLLVIALVLGGVMMGLSTQVELRRISETQKGLDDIKEALIGYAANQLTPYLPCPDKTTAAGLGTANDGLEDVAATGACVSPEGNIPWLTLGVSDLDGWGRRFHYRVSPTYSNRAPLATFTLNPSVPSTLQVCQTASPLTSCVTALPAVILSYGKNGKGAITGTGALIPAATGPGPVAPATNVDEYENANQNDTFVNRPPTAIGGASGEFDDQVTWLTSSILNSRMISAQKLP